MASRADGAKAWAGLLSEIADVPVAVEWVQPFWVVRWRDGPTREALMARAAAIGGYRFGRPLLVAELRFSRSNSAGAIALGWLAVGGPPSLGRLADGLAAVEEFCENTRYPRSRFDDQALGAAELLVRLAGRDHYEMGRLLAGAVPGVPAVTVLPDRGPDLRGRTDGRWSRGGPPEELLGPSPSSPPAAELSTSKERVPEPVLACQHCGRPLAGERRGRPAKYCSGACRTAAHRAHRAADSTGPTSPAETTGSSRTGNGSTGRRAVAECYD